MLNIQEFIYKNKNWEELLSSPPYSLNIKRKDSRILFKYSQINSDASLEIVKEARGLILEDKTWEVISYPFKRFFNYGETYADPIDWKTAKVSSKEDGSLIKVYFYNGWKVGTSGTIDAEDAELSSPIYHNFRELFDVAAKNSNFNFDKLDPHFTYIFELCSRYNQVVCPQGEPKLYHIGTRDNRSLEEVLIDIGVDKPKEYRLSSLEDCIKMAKTFDYKQEGFVVVDKDWNRIKIKSEDYLRVHRLSNNTTLTIERALDLIRMNEVQEFLSYFPYYQNFIDDVKNKLNSLIKKLERIECEAFTFKCFNLLKKDFSIFANKSENPFIWYQVYNNPDFSVIKWINDLPVKKLAKMIKKEY